MHQAANIRVLHISGEIHWQGGERQLSYLLKMLRLRVHHEVICAEGSKLAQYCHDHDIPYHTYKRDFFYRFRLWNTIRKVAKGQIFNLFHCHDRRAHTAAWLSMTYQPLVVNRRASHKLKNNLWSRIKFSSRRLKCIVCPSHFVAEQVAAVMKKAGRIRVVYTSIEESQYELHKRKNILRSELNIDPDTTLIGTVGVVRKRKGHSVFVQAAERLVAQGLPVHFAIIGEGPELASVKELIKEKNLESHVSVMGFRSDLRSIYPDLDLFVLSSSSEGFSSVILEAFANGIPVVASAVGGVTEIVEEEVSGLLAQAGDPEDFAYQIKRLIEKPKLAEKMVANAKAILPKYETQRMANTYHRIYKEAAGTVVERVYTNSSKRAH